MSDKEIIDLVTEAGFSIVDAERDKEYFTAFHKLILKIEHEAVLQMLEAFYNSQDPNPMYQDGYNHALDHVEIFVKRRSIFK